MNARDALEKVLALPEDERRWVVEEAAATLPLVEEDFALAPEDIAELERRIAEHEADPGSAIPWEEAKARVLGLLRR